MSNLDHFVAVFACRFAGDSADMPAGALSGSLTGVRWARIPCGAVVHAGMILQALEQGARGALVISCPETACHYREGARRAATECAKAARLLRLLGHGAARVRHVQAAAGADPLALAGEFARDLDGLPPGGRRSGRGARVEGARR